MFKRPAAAGSRITAIATALAAAALLVACGTGEPSDVPAASVPAGAAQLRGAWSPVPFQVPLAIANTADQACRQGAHNQVPPTAQMVVVDARGGGLLQLWYAAPNSDTTFWSCSDLRLTDDGSIRLTGGFGSMSRTSGPLGQFDIDVVDNSAVGDPVTASYVAGRLGAGIAAVRILRPGLPPMVASVSNAWFAAWMAGPWPKGTTLVGVDAAGAQVATIPIT